MLGVGSHVYNSGEVNFPWRTLAFLLALPVVALAIWMVAMHGWAYVFVFLAFVAFFSALAVARRRSSDG